LSRVEHRSVLQPVIVGDRIDVVAIVCLNLQGLEFVVEELDRHNFRDEFVKELREVLERQREFDSAREGILS